MTKTQKKVYDRCLQANDSGRGGQEHLLVGQTKGVRGSWRGSFGLRTGQKPIKAEETALEQLVASGEILHVYGDYVVKDHLHLQTIASGLNLPRIARTVEECRANLERAEKLLSDAQAFVRQYGK
jgi:hypothetical protein